MLGKVNMAQGGSDVICERSMQAMETAGLGETGEGNQERMGRHRTQITTEIKQ